MKLNKLGFSLTEIVIVIALAGVIVIVLANLPSTLGLIGQSNHQSLANQIIDQKIEDLRSQGYDNISNGTTMISDSRLNQLPGSTSEVIIGDCPTLSPTICTSNEDVKQVSIKITWNETKGPKEVKVVTFIGKGGLQ